MFYICIFYDLIIIHFKDGHIDTQKKKSNIRLQVKDPHTPSTCITPEEQTAVQWVSCVLTAWLE